MDKYIEQLGREAGERLSIGLTRDDMFHSNIVQDGKLGGNMGSAVVTMEQFIKMEARMKEMEKKLKILDLMFPGGVPDVT